MTMNRRPDPPLSALARAARAPAAACCFLGAALGGPAGGIAAVAAPAEAPPPAPPAPPAPYALPFQLRPAIAANALRFDGAFALHDGGAALGSAALFAYQVCPDLAPLLRAGLGVNGPSGGAATAVLLDPQVGVLYTPKVAERVRLAPYAAVALPFGQGGGPAPSSADAAALGAARLARGALDNALFAVNYVTFAGGLGAAYVGGGLTLQVEGTLLYGLRARGPAAQDDAVVNATGGLSAGYFVAPGLSLQAELRHQHFVSTPAAVKRDGRARDQTTAALGARAHLPLGVGKTVRPGLAYAHPLDDPMRAAGYRVVFADVAANF
jgi:hypothetical protein